MSENVGQYGTHPTMLYVRPVGRNGYYLSGEVTSVGEDPRALRMAAPTAGELVMAFLDLNESQSPLCPECLKHLREKIHPRGGGEPFLGEVTASVIESKGGDKDSHYTLFQRPDAVLYDQKHGWIVEGNGKIVDKPANQFRHYRGGNIGIAEFDVKTGFPLKCVDMGDDHYFPIFVEPRKGLSIVSFAHTAGREITTKPAAGRHLPPSFTPSCYFNFSPIPLDRNTEPTGFYRDSYKQHTGVRRIVRESDEPLPDSVVVQGPDVERFLRLLRTHPNDPAAASSLLNSVGLGNYPVVDK